MAKKSQRCIETENARLHRRCAEQREQIEQLFALIDDHKEIVATTKKTIATQQRMIAELRRAARPSLSPLVDHARQVRLMARYENNPILAIADFVLGSARDIAKAHQEHVVEFIATRFERWIYDRAMPMDEAFGVSGGGKGRTSPREKYLTQHRDRMAKSYFKIYLQEELARQQRGKSLRGERTASDRAIARVSKLMGIPEPMARRAVYRSRVSLNRI